MGSLEDEVAEEKRRNKMASRRISQLTEELRSETVKRERAEGEAERRNQSAEEPDQGRAEKGLPDESS